MSVSTSLFTQKQYGLQRVCAVWGVNRSTVYFRRKRVQTKTNLKKRGPKPKLSDDLVMMEIRKDLNESPFTGEGHRKVHARIRNRKKIVTGRGRVLKLMKKNDLLSPYRSFKGSQKAHDGRIITDNPNKMWATDATKVQTVDDGIVWFFGIIEHWNAECLGWRVAKRGNRFVALDALAMAVKNQFVSIERGCAKGLSLRPDHGSQFVSHDYRNQMSYWGITPSFSLVREPETNGVVERFHRTLKEQIVHGREYQNLKEFEEAVAKFIKTYNEKWILEKLGYLSPLEARNRLEVENVG